MKITSFLSAFLLTIQLFAQTNISISDSLINFGEVNVGESFSESITITNDSENEVEILTFHIEELEFQTDLTEQTINPNSTLEFEITFSPRHNINYKDFLFIAFADTNKIFTIELIGTGITSNSYYSSTQNLWGEQLKNALHDIIDNHNSLGYTFARDNMYGSIDNDNGWVTCVYTGREAQFDDRPGANSNSFNCEHTWPQSFFDQDEPMRSDIFHLYPTDVNANGRRSNYDLGVVTSGITWQEGGSKLGKNDQNMTVFEPRDVHKGNAARSHFYFTVRYNGSYDDYQNSELMESIFREWHLADTVDQNEIDRNDAIYDLQNNRNPFIDHPEFVERIPKFFGSEEYQFFPEISLPQFSINMDTVYQSETAHFIFDVVNTGMASLDITSISACDTNFSVEYGSNMIKPESKLQVKVIFDGNDIAGEYTTTVRIESDEEDEGIIEIPVSIFVDELTSIENELVSDLSFQLNQNYPNPFNPTTSIEYIVPSNEYVILKVYDAVGKEVQTLVDEFKNAGSYQVFFNGENLSSGVYIYKIQTESFTQSMKMLLLK